LELQKDNKIKFSKLNMAKNETSIHMNVPNLVFFPQDNYHNMKAYQGDLSLAKITQFIQNQILNFAQKEL
jgi:hypothetical protein